MLRLAREKRFLFQFTIAPVTMRPRNGRHTTVEETEVNREGKKRKNAARVKLTKN